LEKRKSWLNSGLSEAEIPEYIITALKRGKIVDYQNTRPIYEFIYKGKKRRVAITVGDNGFIVGANTV